MIKRLLKSFMPQKDPRGGMMIAEEDINRAKSADLVTLPQGVHGKNCGNCDFYSPDHTCKNRNLQGISVNERMGCKLWYNIGIYESWKHAR